MDRQILNPDHRQSGALGYAVAVLSVALALGITELLQPDMRPPPLFFLAVSITAWYGGLAASGLAALLSVLAVDYFLLTPIYSLKPSWDDLLLFLFFMLTALLIDYESRRRRRAEASLRRALEELDAKVKERTAELAAANASLRAQAGARAHSQAALSQSEQRYRELFENANDMVYTLDLEGHLTGLNKAGERMLGYSRDEMMNRPITALIKPEDMARMQEMMQRKLKGEQLTTYEIEITTKGGRQVTLEISSRLIYNAGVPAGIQGTARDITGRKRTQEALRLSEERYRTLVDAMQQLIWVNDAEGRNTYVNRQWRQYMGLSAPMQHGLDWFTLTHADDVETVRRARARGLDAGEAYECELRIRRKDGVYRWHLLRTVPMRDADGRIIQWFGTATDIHNIKLAEEGERFLAEASTTLASTLDYQVALERLARLVVERLADWCVIDILEDGDFRPLAVAHRDTAKEPGLRQMRSRYPVVKERPSLVRDVAQSGTPVLLPEVPASLLNFYSRDDEHFQAISDLSPRSSMVVPLIARGRALGVISLAIAESDRRYDETDLALARDLARHAALAIDNARLYREAQEANRLKDEFLATVSHELRTPLNAIMGWAEMLRAGRLDGEMTAQAYETIARNAKSQARIIDDILDVSRIITGKLRLDAEPVELAAIVGTVIEAVRPAALAKKITLDVALDEAASAVSGDAGRLQQVAWNLLSNAIKFTQENGRVTVRLDRDGAEARLTVCDDGCGIKPEFLPHVFDRFRQADSSYTRRHGGLGLGLAIVRHLVEMHGGTVMAESAGEDQGATFIVRLPLLPLRVGVPARDAHLWVAGGLLNKAAEGLAADNRAELTIGNRQSAILDGLWLLVVDDDRDARELLTEALGQRGAKVTSAGSATEAMAVLAAGTSGRQPDVLLSDLGMPGADGLDLIQQIRASTQAALREMPAIALTAYARPEDRARVLEAGYQMHVAKPFDTDELIRAILALAEQHQRNSAAQ
jgi:PAS domain S-box-containing protein